MVAFLRLEKLRRRDARAAAAARRRGDVRRRWSPRPMLNRDTPWFDYETWAAETSASKSTTFTWDHSYGRLNWPRDGRELLRVARRSPRTGRPRTSTSSTASTGCARQARPRRPTPAERPRLVQRWTQKIKVSIRNLRTDQFITAGYAFDVAIPRLTTVPTLDGLSSAPRTLRRGDAYTAQSTRPSPTERQRRRAASTTTRR